MKKHLLLFVLLLLISGAMFAEDEYNITYLPDATQSFNGCYLSGNPTANADSTVTVTIHTEAGYELDSISAVDDNYEVVYLIGSGNTRHFTMPASNVTVYATFTQADYAIEYTNGGHGTCSGPATAHYNETVSVTVEPDSGYELNTLSYTPEGGTAIDITSSMQFTMPANAVTVHATFTQTEYTIEYTNGGHGTCSGPATAHYNETVSVTVEPDSGYELNTLSYTPEGGTAIDITSSMQFTMPASAVTVNATFIQTHIVTVSANLTDGGVPCIGNDPEQTQATFTHGQSCTVNANPSLGYTFNNWKENGSVVSNQSNYTFTVTNNRDLVAHFTQDSYTITVLASPPQGGTVTGGGAFHYGDSIRLTANANLGYEFHGWDDGSTENPYRIMVTGAATYTAVFGEVGTTYYNVTATVNPAGSGSVTGTGPYAAGSTTQLTAIPNNGYTFNHWQDGNTQNPRDITVNSNMSFTAYFTQNTYTITTQVSPAGSGTVTGGGPGFHYGDQTTLTATANSGYTFDHWNGGSHENPRQITVTGNATYTAYFTQAGPTEYTITTNVTPEGAGIVNGGGTYPTGTQVTLEAIANEGYTFKHWQDGNIQNPRTIMVTGDATYTATFEIAQYTITVNANNDDWGSVSGGGIFSYGDTIQIAATANIGFEFAGWNDGNNDNPREIRVTGNATYTAFFQPEGTTTYYIGADILPENTGRVVGIGYYQYGEIVDLLAEPYHGYEFRHWEDESEGNPRQITVTGNAIVKAFFRPKTYTITATADPDNGGTITGDGNYVYETSCTLIATANDGYNFTNWTENGIVVNSNASYTFIVNDDRNLVANFTPIHQFTITARSNNSEWGTVSGGGLYNAGVNCTLRATPADGCRFENWKKNGVVVSGEPDYTFEVTGNATYTAFFSKMPTTIYIIETEVNPANAGTVTGGGQHEAGSTVELSATANQGYSFSHWQDDNTDNPREITVTSNATYTAYFVPLQYEITTRVEPEESGSVSGDGTYDYGSMVTLTATANAGYTFDRWDDGNTDNPRTVIVTGDMEFVVIFKEIPCIDNLQKIVAKEHKEGNDTYILILVYPNPDDESYTYQWLYSNEEDGEYSNLKEGTYSKQYYYKGGRLTEGFYKVRVTKGDCSAETEPYHVTYSGNTIRIYPNPSRRGNNITVVNDDDGPAQLTIYSTDGRQLYTQTITGDQANIGVNLPQGVYVAYLINKDGYTKVGKLIIQ